MGYKQQKSDENGECGIGLKGFLVKNRNLDLKNMFVCVIESGVEKSYLRADKIMGRKKENRSRAKLGIQMAPSQMFRKS